MPIPSLLVTGATGTTGRRVIRQLAGAGAAVRAASRTARRTPWPEGVEAAHFDWHDRSTHFEAARDITAAYLVPPIDAPDTAATLMPFIDTAQQLGVRRMVLLSASILQAGDAFTGRVHEDLLTRPIESIVLRPTWFAQNLLPDDHTTATAIAEREIVTATGDGRVPLIDAADIAAVAARALTAPSPIADDLVLTGPEALSYDEVAATLTATTGRTVRHRRVSTDDLVVYLEQHGAPSAAAQHLASLDGLIASGVEDRTTHAVARILGRAPTRFADVAADWSRRGPLPPAPA